LDEQTLEDLGSDTLEECCGTFVLYDVLHNFGEGLERLAIPGWRGF
jgi:hypothetical protein